VYHKPENAHAPDYLTQADVQNYGTDLVDFAQRAAAHAVAPQLQYMQEQMKSCSSSWHAKPNNGSIWRLMGRCQTGAHQPEPTLAAMAGKNHDLNGRTRQELLNNATAAGDAHRVIRFFKGFLQEYGGASQARGATTAPGGRPFYTRAQIAWLYNQHRKGAYRGREAEWARIDADIIAAGREGRVLDAQSPTGSR